MEKLTKAQQDSIKKASTDRLRLNLLKADFAEDEVLLMERDTLQATWAEVVAKGGGATRGPTAGGYDPAIEKGRLEFEKMKFQQELELQKQKQAAEIEIQKQKQEAEREALCLQKQKQEEDQRKADREFEFQKQKQEADLELQKQKQEDERAALEFQKQKQEDDQRKAERELEFQKQKWEKEAELQQQQLNLQEAEREARAALKDDTAASVKKFGEALRNAVTRQPNDAWETPTFFRNVEALFSQLKVPAALRGMLIRPFLNDRCKVLVARLDAAEAAQYDVIKAAILNELKLNPASYREKFNTLRKEEGETYISYASRLKTLLTRYIESRLVRKFDELVDLILCDRLKVALSVECLKYVLTIESTDTAGRGWIDSGRLTEAVDAYYANQVDKPRSRTFGSIMNSGATQSNAPPAQPTESNENQSTGFHENKSTSSKKQDASEPRACFTCGSLLHLKFQCPHNPKNRNSSADTDSGTQSTRRVNRCAAQNVTMHVENESIGPSTGGVGRGAAVPAEAGEVRSPPSSGPEGFTAARSRCDDVQCNVLDVENDIGICGVANLRYSRVGVAARVDCTFINVNALEDSGAQIAVINAQLIDQLVDVEVLGTVALKGVIGKAVTCKLVRLYVRLAMAEDTFNNDSLCKPITITCAVSDDSPDSLLLPLHVIEQLRALYGDDVRSSEGGGDDDRSVSSIESLQVVDKIVTAVISNDELLHANVVTRSGRNSNTRPNNGSDVASIKTPTAETGSKSVSANESTSDCDFVNADIAADFSMDVNLSSTTRQALANEQRSDATLQCCFKQCENGRGNFYLEEGLLLKRDKILGQDIKQLVLPEARRAQVLELGHGVAGAHMAGRNTANRIRLNFWWPTIRADTMKYCASCPICQQRARVTCWDRVPIKPIPRAEEPFSHWFMDVGGPLSSEKLPYNYFLVLCDSMSRFPVAYALRNVNSRTICDSLLQLFSFVGVPSYLSMDNATYNVSQWTQEMIKRVGVSPRFITPYHSPADGLVERLVSSTKSLIAKVAAENPKSWHKHLGYIMWALREVPNETTHVPPALLAWGRIPRGPLAILKETWCGERELPPGLGKEPTEYLKELLHNLQIAKAYAESHAQRSQQLTAERYNRRSKEKSFEVGDEVLILKTDSTKSRVFSKWRGPAKIVTVKSPYSYIVELDGARHNLHANHLRRYNVRVEQVVYDSTAFGGAINNALDIPPTVIAASRAKTQTFNVSTCAIIHDEDTDFGAVQTIGPPSSDEGKPSQKIDRKESDHLTERQQTQLLDLLDRYPEVFRGEPGLCKLVEHEIPVTSDFVPKRLRAYRIPERLKPEVERQIQDLLRQGFIRRSTSPMASPLVCVLKGPGGRDGVRLAVDFRYLNKYSISDAFPVPDIQEVIQKIGNARYISTFDANSGYWQIKIKESDQWKSAFVCGDELYEWTRTAFGMRSSGNTFCRAVELVLKPIKSFARSFLTTWRSTL